MKKIKKCVFVLCLLCMSLFLHFPVYANENIQVEEGIDVRVKWQKEDISYEKEIPLWNEEDTLMYQGGLFEELDLASIEENVKEKLILISCFGYNSSLKKEEYWYYTTQLLIWEELGYEFEVVHFDMYDTYKNQILHEIENFLTISEEENMTLRGKENYVFNEDLYIQKENVETLLLEKNVLSSLTNETLEAKLTLLKDVQKEGLDILFKEGQILEVKYQNTLAKEVDVKVQPYGYISVSVEKEMPVFVNGVTSEYGEIKQVGYTRIKQRNEEVEIYAKEDIYDVWGNLVYAKDYCIQKILTNEDFVQSEALLKGEYYAKWQDRIVDFSIEEGEDIPNLSILFFKERNKGSITLQKTFEKGSREDLSYAYKDIVYGIYSEEAIYDSNSNILIDKDTLVYVSKIDANGYLVETMDLPIGKYYLKELATHALYEIDANTYRFEITEDTTSPIKINETGIIESKLKRMNLTIYNTNEKVNTSLYARFVLYDEDMNEITSFEVDKNGKYVVEDLVEGIYYLQEVEVEKGYKLNGTIQSINTSENRNIHIKNVETTPTNVVSTKDASQHQKWEVTMLLSMLVFYNAFKRSMKY